jgi:hypothetical protein
MTLCIYRNIHTTALYYGKFVLPVGHQWIPHFVQLLYFLIMGQLVPRRVGVDGFCVVIINLIQFCAFVGLNYSNEICLTFTSRDMAVQLLPRCENVGDMGVSKY